MYIELGIELGSGGSIGTLELYPPVTVYSEGTPGNASYALLLDGNGDEIGSTGDYVQGTGIALTGASYADSILQVDDFDVDLVDASVRYVDIYDSDDKLLIHFDLGSETEYSPGELNFVWPTAGVDFSVTSAYSANKSNEGEFVISPTLRSAKLTDTTVTIVITGGHSDQEDYGLGKHYTLAFEGGAETGETIGNTAYNTTVVTAIIPTGELARNITMTIENNPAPEYDRVINILAPLFGAPKTVTIVDDNLDYLIDVTSASDVQSLDAGLSPLVADGTDNRPLLQAIFDELRDNNPDTQPVLYFPAGTYHF